MLKYSIKQFNQKQESSILKITEENPDKLGFKPPSSFYSSNFLNQFQEIVNTYGIPKYREINPAVFTAISFPFLFGLMFGDIAHGFVLFCFALFLFFKSKSISISLSTSFMTIRSLAITLLLMGTFSVYVGAVYNDFLALPLTFFPSCYSHNGDKYGIIPHSLINR
jgi:V-type H+-transporting ATPase subunit a